MLLAEFYKGAPDLVRFQEAWSPEHTYLDKLKVRLCNPAAWVLSGAQTTSQSLNKTSPETRGREVTGSGWPGEPSCQLLTPACGLRSPPPFCVEFTQEGALHCTSLRL